MDSAFYAKIVAAKSPLSSPVPSGNLVSRMFFGNRLKWLAAIKELIEYIISKKIFLN